MVATHLAVVGRDHPYAAWFSMRDIYIKLVEAWQLEEPAPSQASVRRALKRLTDGNHFHFVARGGPGNLAGVWTTRDEYRRAAAITRRLRDRAALNKHGTLAGLAGKVYATERYLLDIINKLRANEQAGALELVLEDTRTLLDKLEQL
jgi:hypothetical protein